ncbi:hypothetical protein [Nocardioides sp. cx-173]|uniref:hypothetical protein n=1 Tax=Nocardioides sp. cx-173 TaxID=2898796 RepID=UPI001E5FE9F7|nr:hypothetical protein [Nocardioides sp. cx-173]MCD4526279.1 hypothetical protein [Nocardioides sp. cx-173]UGB40513.1 hypothetical protein LQ940_14115 [Nocardioides sp. cx-173]
MTEQPSITAPSAADDSSTAAERAQSLRENIRGLRDVDALLAEAGRLKREAAAEADQLVAEAQALSVELLGEAEQRAEGIVGVARDEADLVRGRLESVLVGIEGSVREFGAHLEGALRSVDALAKTLEQVRAEPAPESSGTSERPDPAGPAEPAGPTTAAAPAVADQPPVPGKTLAEVEPSAPGPAQEPAQQSAQNSGEHEGGPTSRVSYRQDASDEPAARPLGWLFRQTSS